MTDQIAGADGSQSDQHSASEAFSAADNKGDECVQQEGWNRYEPAYERRHVSMIGPNKASAEFCRPLSP